MLSLIVPVYQTEALLPRCVDSILGQTCGDFELILVDDGSTDRCPAICDAYAARDPRVRVIHQPNGGVVSARNSGVGAARGEYVCFVDSDDWVSDRLVETLNAQVFSRCAPDVVVFNYCTVSAGSKKKNVLKFDRGYYGEKAMEAAVLPRFLSDREKGRWWEPGISSYLWGKAFRAQHLRGHLFIDTAVALGEDAAMTYENIAAARSLFICDDCLYYYSRDAGVSASRMYRRNLCDMFSRQFAYMAGHIGGRSEAIDRQLNDYFAYRILRAVYIHVEYGAPVREASRLLSEGFRRARLTRYVHLKGLPLPAGGMIILLRLRLYPLILALLKIGKGVKEKRARRPGA